MIARSPRHGKRRSGRGYVASAIPPTTGGTGMQTTLRPRTATTTSSG
jgi:hypothetical protein